MPRAKDEPVRLTRIYTRGGDAERTSLGDGSRVPKTDRRIAAFGTVDELNALLGVVLADPDCRSRCACRSSASRTSSSTSARSLHCRRPLRAGSGSSRRWSTRWRLRPFQRRARRTPQLRAPRWRRRPRRSHVARTVCRRAERETIAAAQEHDVSPLCAVYLNRLSDLLFILARSANALAAPDEPL